MTIKTRIAALAANWTVRLIAFAVLVAIIIGLASSFLSGQSAKTEVKLRNNQVEAAVTSGQDAVETVGDVMASEEETDRQTRENEDEIRNAEGADAPVDPDVRDAGLRSLCRRAANKQRPECLQFAPAP